MSDATMIKFDARAPRVRAYGARTPLPVGVAGVLALGMGVLGGVSVAPAYAALPLCATEDSVSCYWDASARGNGEGRSFYTDAAGNVYYVTPAGH